MIPNTWGSIKKQTGYCEHASQEKTKNVFPICAIFRLKTSIVQKPDFLQKRGAHESVGKYVKKRQTIWLVVCIDSFRDLPFYLQVVRQQIMRVQGLGFFGESTGMIVNGRWRGLFVIGSLFICASYQRIGQTTLLSLF